MNYKILFFILISAVCRAQPPGNSVVFKVRAKMSECTITCQGDQFLLEINNPVVIKVSGKNQKIKVIVPNGKIISTEGDTYYIRFISPGIGVISVYLDTPKGRMLMATKKLPLKKLPIYFCGVKMDSTSRSIKMRGMNFYAYSDFYKQNMPISSFDMYYVDDTTLRKTEPLHFKSDTCMLSPEMKKKILSFQPNHNYIYFHNIICTVPDGSKRILDPIELNIVEDTTNKEKLSLMYSVRKKKL